MRLCAAYLTRRLSPGNRIDPVAHFHLGNGAKGRAEELLEGEHIGVRITHESAREAGGDPVAELLRTIKGGWRIQDNISMAEMSPR